MRDQTELVRRKEKLREKLQEDPERIIKLANWIDVSMKVQTLTNAQIAKLIEEHILSDLEIFSHKAVVLSSAVLRLQEHPNNIEPDDYDKGSE